MNLVSTIKSACKSAWDFVSGSDSMSLALTSQKMLIDFKFARPQLMSDIYTIKRLFSNDTALPPLCDACIKAMDDNIEYLQSGLDKGNLDIYEIVRKQDSLDTSIKKLKKRIDYLHPANSPTGPVNE
jgi:hypothetical protein